MTEQDPSDRLLHSLTLVGGTPQRDYYIDEPNNILVASWRMDAANVYDMEAFQNNALYLAKLIEEKKPKSVVVDCRHLGFEVSDSDQRWYVNQTRSLWEKTSMKKVAFIFKANLSVQMSMEGLRDVAAEEGVRPIENRIFESVPDAFNWVKNS